MAASTFIWGIRAREIIDSRATPTIETIVILDSGYRGVVGVPAGASMGDFEAIELRDNDTERYNGKGVLAAVKNVNTLINDKLKGMDAKNQQAIDAAMFVLDGTDNKSRLGSNAILGVSLACAVAVAQALQMPLYIYLNQLFNSYVPIKIEKIPTPIFNLINGGLHGTGNLNFQEFQVVPATNRSYHLALQVGVEIYKSVEKMLTTRNASHAVGDEGGFTPNLYTNLDALEILTESIRQTPYRLGVDVFLGLDVAANHFKTDHGYEIKDRALPFSTEEFIKYLKELHAKYRLLYLEDALEENDMKGWSELVKTLSNEVHIVGDDLLSTNPKRLKKAIDMKACTTILLKPNQIGTLSEFMEVAQIAKQHDIKIVTSHRIGETNDSFIADLAVAIGSDYVKFGAPARGERVAKYNRLLAIEQEIPVKKG